MNYIWRLETEEGDGIYNAGMFMRNNEIDYYHRIHHPTPKEDFEDDPTYIESNIYGFKDIITARRWWCSIHDLKKWSKDGLKLAVFKNESCINVIEGTNQVVFKRPEYDPLYLPCEFLHTKPIDKLTKLADSHFANQGII
jgi:hypothetical protein